MDASGEQGSRDGAGPAVTLDIAAEAAVWIARLHGPDRSAHMERECLAWQARSAAHRLAFERCTDVWEEVPRVKLADAYASASSRDSGSGAQVEQGAGRSTRLPWALASMFAVLVAGAGLFIHLRGDDEVYATKVGEQQLVVLDDGTRMSLNTDSHVRVEIGPKLRAVNVQRGEALFEVAKDSSRPFVVRVAGSEVVALGTVFSVRLAGSDAHLVNALAVTLVEGQVTVRPASGVGAHEISPAGPVVLQAGERIRLVKANGRSSDPASSQVDRPRIEQMLAWKRSEVDFEDVALPEAVAEMNRYNRTPIVLLGNGALSQLRVSGLYRTGDSSSFAQAIATLHGLVVQERSGRLELAPPQ